MEAKIAGAILIVRLVTDMLKAKYPNLTGRWTQAVVLALSIVGGVYAAGVTDIQQIITATGAIFAGSIAFYQVIKREA